MTSHEDNLTNNVRHLIDIYNEYLQCPDSEHYNKDPHYIRDTLLKLVHPKEDKFNEGLERTSNSYKECFTFYKKEFGELSGLLNNYKIKLFILPTKRDYISENATDFDQIFVWKLVFEDEIKKYLPSKLKNVNYSDIFLEDETHILCLNSINSTINNSDISVLCLYKRLLLSEYLEQQNRIMLKNFDLI